MCKSLLSTVGFKESQWLTAQRIDQYALTSLLKMIRAY